MVMPEELATAMNKYFAGGYAAATPALAAPTGTNSRGFNDLAVEYDFARQALRITQSGDDTIHFTTDAPLSGELFGAVDLGLSTPGDATERSTALATTDSLASADGDKAVVLSGTMVPAGDAIAETRNQRYGIEVNFLDGSFVISSGTTGDGSSIAIRNVATLDTNGNAATAIPLASNCLACQLLLARRRARILFVLLKNYRLSPTALLFAAKPPCPRSLRETRWVLTHRSLLR